MDNSTQYELMKYLDGEMTESEKAELEQKLATDERLKGELENLQLAKAAVLHYGLKERVSHIHGQMMKELKTEAPVKKMGNVRRIIRYSVAVAASVLLVFLAIEGYNFYRLSPNRLFAENYTAYELSTTRDGASASETAIEKAYRQKDYTEVIRLNATSVLTAKDIFLTAMSYLETGDVARAISNYQVVLADAGAGNNPMLKEVTEYYLALAWLKNRDYDEAIELMNAIRSNPTHLYKEKFSRRYINRVKRLKWR